MDSSLNGATLPYAGNLDFADRQRVLKTLARETGLRLPETIVPEGESLIPYGEERRRALQAEVSALPDLAEGLTSLRAQIKAQSPKDIEVPINAVRMSPTNGGLYGEGKPSNNALAYTEAGFSHVVGYVKPSGVQSVKGTLLALPPAIRAQAFNHFASTNVRKESDPVMLRTLVDNRGRRLVRAVTSRKHSLETGDDLAVASALERALPKGGKLRVTRTWDRSDFEILFPFMTKEVLVGDVVMGKIHVTNSETKAGSLVVSGGILRVLCLNFTTAWAEDLEEISTRHVGDVGRRLAQAVRRAIDTITPFIEAFGKAYSTALPGNLTRAEVLQRVGKVYQLPDTTLTLSAQLWDADGIKSAGDTLAGLANALTRASQQAGMAEASVIEGVAGKVIAQGWDAIGA